jgi:phage antirepressor YoqD-like protein
MSELQIINRQEVLGKDFKVYGTPDEPLFLAKDVAEWIEHSDSAKMVQSVDDNEKLLRTLFVSGQNREVWFLTEDGLYEVLMQSRKLIAKQFKAKVKEILKTIRRHGMYATNELLDNPDLLIEAATRIKVQRQQIQQLEADKSALTVDLAIAQPKAAYFDELVDRNLLTGFRETAKLLKISEKKFVAFLIDHKYIYRDKNGKLCPKVDKNDGLFEIKECYNEKTDWRGTQTLVTPKGRETFRLLCQGM